MPVDFEISPLITPAPTEASGPLSTPQPTQPSVTLPPDMKKRSSKMLQWLILAAAGAFVIMVGALLWGGNSFSDKDVELTFTAPDHATSGDQITYTVTYKNNTNVDLTNMSFRLFYPNGSIVLKDSKPTTPESEAFVVETLKPGQSETKEFTAFLVGDKGTIQTAKLNLIFKAGTLRSSFEREVTAATTITALPVTLTLVAPPTAVSGQMIEYLLDLRNDSGSDLSDLKVAVTYPDGFVVQKMTPTPTSGNTSWDVDTLKAAERKRISITGALSGNEREARTITAVLQRNLNGQYVDYVRTDSFTMISSPLLSVTVSPENGRDYVAFPGDTLRYTIPYANNSRYTLLGMALGVKLEGDMYDTSRLISTQGSYDDSTRTLSFNSGGVSDFAAFPPGRTGKLTFSVPLKAGLSGSTLGGAKTFYVKATAQLSTTNVPTGIDGTEVSANDSVITKIGSQPSLASAALFDNGAGSGSLPPVVGSETALTIRWQLTNPGNDVRNAVVTATLPTGVTFKGGAATANGTAPTYDSNRNIVTWSVGTLPFGTGNGTARYEATFQVSIKPSANQKGSSVKLLTATALTGVDSFTGLNVQSNARDVTTDDVENHLNQGRVQ
jgi:uncharacterized repeat protein (TIGR01451 family)